MEVKLKRKVKEGKTIHFNGRYILFMPRKVYTIDNEALLNHLLDTGDFEEKKYKPLKIKPIEGIKDGTKTIKEISLRKTIKKKDKHSIEYGKDKSIQGES